MTPRTLRTPTISEAEFQAAVVDLAHALGWRHNFTRRTIGRGKKWTTATSCVGWPDCVFFGPRGHFYVEVKSETGKVTADQERVHALLRESGQRVYVWRPSDWDAAVRVFRGDEDAPH